MRHRSLSMYPDSGNHWSVGIGGMEKGVANLVQQNGGVVPTDEQGNTQFVLIQLGEDRPFGKLSHEQIRLQFTTQEAKWLIGEIEDAMQHMDINASEVSFDLPQAAPASLPPPNLSRINLDISNEDMVGSV